VSTNPNINFVVYVPTRDQSPLYIYDESGFCAVGYWCTLLVWWIFI